MKEIGVVIFGSINDIGNWSGTGYYLPKFLKEKYKITEISVKEDFFCLLVKLLARMFNRKTCSLYYYLLRIKCKSKIVKAKKEGVRKFVAIACSPIISEKVFPDDVKVLYLTDATTELMQNYYWSYSRLDFKLMDKYEAEAINRSDICVTSSDWAAKSVIEYYKKDANKVFVVPFPSYFDKDYYNKKNYRNLYNKRNINALLVGMDFERKGVDVAIKTIEICNSVQDKFFFNLKIVGGGNKLNKNFGDNIEFLGPLDKNDNDDLAKMIKLYQESDFFLLPTKAECAGIVFSEACMFGLPIFTSNTGGIGNYVIDGFNGEKVNISSEQALDLSNAILKALKDEKIVEYSANSRFLYLTKLNKDSWLTNLSKLIDLFLV